MYWKHKDLYSILHSCYYIIANVYVFKSSRLRTHNTQSTADIQITDYGSTLYKATVSRFSTFQHKTMKQPGFLYLNLDPQEIGEFTPKQGTSFTSEHVNLSKFLYGSFFNYRDLQIVLQ